MSLIRKKRVSRACTRCRKHKSKCVLERSGHILKPPCEKCLEAGVECILATSNRGGFRRRKTVDVDPEPTNDEPNTTASQYAGLDLSSTWSSPEDTLGSNVHHGDVDYVPQGENTCVAEETNIDETFVAANLHGTSDALNILSQIAHDVSADPLGDSHSTGVLHLHSVPDLEEPANGLFDYYLVRSGALTPEQVLELLERFRTTYHQFYPIAPSGQMHQENISATARRESHLLTAMITIGSKDMMGYEHIFKACGQYMQTLITRIAAGKKCGVEAVEALLLLAEWEPRTVLPDTDDLCCGQEDISAWMHIGLAIRLAYALKLDKTTIRHDQEDKTSSSRERLAWAACYLSDRQISIRIGRPFACRGLEPSIAYGRHGFPVIESQNPRGETSMEFFQNLEDENLSRVFQARLELTQIFTSVHEVLYCNLSASTPMMLLGGYASYLDDFRGAISIWNSLWGSLTCPLNLKVMLQLSYEYLRLYANAFSFQAAALRNITPRQQSSQYRFDRIKGPGDLPEIRFMYEAIDAAKALLTVFNNYAFSMEDVNAFPIRFPLYCVNAAVFLFKIWNLGVISNPERSSIRILIRDTVSSFQRGTSNASLELGARYSHLLETLWGRVDSRNSDNERSNTEQPTRPSTHPSDSGPFPYDSFSWLDLEAIGGFVWPDTTMNGGTESSDPQPHFDFSRDIDWVDNNVMAVNEFSRIF